MRCQFATSPAGVIPLPLDFPATISSTENLYPVILNLHLLKINGSYEVRCSKNKTKEYPTPAMNTNSTEDKDEVDRATNASTEHSISSREGQRSCKEALPGTLPASATTLSTASRGLLMRLLERDPKVRLRSLRQLQQSAFYMSYNFEHVKAKKVSPRSILERYFPPEKSLEDGNINNSYHHFPSFDQQTMAI